MDEFILLGFTGVWEVQVFLFAVLLVTYIMTLAGNLTIISIIWTDHRFQTPMYFFLSNLSFLDILFTSVISPKMLINFMMHSKTISYGGCIAQCYLYFLLGTVEFMLLAVMSVDRYVAICYPLRYTTIMNNKVCLLMMLGCWAGAFFSVLTPVIELSRLPFCNVNVLDHFFCDIAPLIQASCANTHFFEMLAFISSSIVVLSSLILTSVSYSYIISTIVSIPSATGRKKAFSTCVSHIIVVTIAYGSSIFMYVRPEQSYSLDFDKVAAVLTTVVTPLLNPFIYSLRNEKVKEVLRESWANFKSYFK
ncbi:olfactory receptor 6M1-like [Alligator mississippiensis]|nr:olfactory receptor 6M1-like [Alligator mississippiensis]